MFSLQIVCLIFYYFWLIIYQNFSYCVFPCSGITYWFSAHLKNHEINTFSPASMQIKKKSLFQSFLPSKFIDHLVNFWIVQQVKFRSSPLIQSFPFNSHAHLLTLNNTNQLKFLEKRRNLIFVVKKMCTFNFSPT